MNNTRNTFARYTFLIAGIYGVIVMFPMYFLEQKTGADYPPVINHPEYYYSFVGVTLVWQILFFLVARNPERFRPIMLVCVFEKLSLIPTFLILFPGGRFPETWLLPLIIDLVFGAFFLTAFVRTEKGDGNVRVEGAS